MDDQYAFGEMDDHGQSNLARFEKQYGAIIWAWGLVTCSFGPRGVRRACRNRITCVASSMRQAK